MDEREDDTWSRCKFAEKNAFKTREARFVVADLLNFLPVDKIKYTS